MGKEILVIDDYYCFCNILISLCFDEYASIYNIVCVIILKSTTELLGCMMGGNVSACRV